MYDDRAPLIGFGCVMVLAAISTLVAVAIWVALVFIILHLLHVL